MTITKDVSTVLNAVAITAGSNTTGSVIDLSSARSAGIGFSIYGLGATSTYVTLAVYASAAGVSTWTPNLSYDTPLLTKKIYSAGSGIVKRGFIQIPKTPKYVKINIVNNYSSQITASAYSQVQNDSNLQKTVTQILTNATMAAQSRTPASSEIDLRAAIDFGIGFTGSISNEYGCGLEIMADPTGAGGGFTIGSADRLAERVNFLNPSNYSNNTVFPLDSIGNYFKARLYNWDLYNTRSSLNLYSHIQTFKT